jgi:hypothetical protein
LSADFRIRLRFWPPLGWGTRLLAFAITFVPFDT